METSESSRTGREMGAMAVAAIVLGIAYNAISPLGISSTPPAITAGISRPTGVVPDPTLENVTLTATIVAGGPATAPPAPGGKLPVAMAWAQVKPLLTNGKIALIDVRDPTAFAAGHIPGAISLPLQQLTQQIGAFSAQHPRQEPLTVYCASLQCPMAHAAAMTLMEQYGFLDVREMPGGYAEWRVAEGNAVGGQQ